MYRRKDDPTLSLDRAARRRIRRAVRRGLAVHDPREAPYAAAYAELVTARLQPIPLGVPVLVALLAGGIVAVAAGAARPVYVVPLLVAAAVRPLQRRWIERARTAAAANRQHTLTTGVQLLEYEPPTPAWQGVTAWGVAGLIVVVVALHIALSSTGGTVDEALPPPTPEPAPIAIRPGWEKFAAARCRAAAKAIRRLPATKAVRVRRLEIQEKLVLAIGDYPAPPAANGALLHLNAALRAERQASRALAAREARYGVDLLEEVGVRGCAAAFG